MNKLIYFPQMEP